MHQRDGVNKSSEFCGLAGFLEPFGNFSYLRCLSADDIARICIDPDLEKVPGTPLLLEPHDPVQGIFSLGPVHFLPPKIAVPVIVRILHP